MSKSISSPLVTVKTHTVPVKLKVRRHKWIQRVFHRYFRLKQCFKIIVFLSLCPCVYSTFAVFESFWSAAGFEPTYSPLTALATHKYGDHLTKSTFYSHNLVISGRLSEKRTSRDRPKSAPYPRLKNSKRNSKCLFTVLEKRKGKKIWTDWRDGAASASLWRAKRGTLPKLSTFLSQLTGGPFGEKTNFRKKVSQCQKLKGGPFGIF